MLTLPPCVVVVCACVCVCVLNTCSPYPCHSGHRIALHRRVPGLAQLAAQEHQEHELRQPRLPQDHGGRRRRDPHRATQRVHRPRVPSSEWQPQSAVHSAPSRGRRHRQQLSLVLGGADALQWEMREATEEKEEYFGIWDDGQGFDKSLFVVHVGLVEGKSRLAHAQNLTHHFCSKSYTHTHKPFHQYIYSTFMTILVQCITSLLPTCHPIYLYIVLVFLVLKCLFCY